MEKLVLAEWGLLVHLFQALEGARPAEVTATRDRSLEKPLWLRTAGDMEGPGKTERRQHLSPRILSKTNKPSSHLRKYILGLQLVPKAGQAGTPSLGPQTQSCPHSRARRQCEPNRPGTRLEGGWREAGGVRSPRTRIPGCCSDGALLAGTAEPGAVSCKPLSLACTQCWQGVGRVPLPAHHLWPTETDPCQGVSLPGRAPGGRLAGRQVDHPYVF